MDYFFLGQEELVTAFRFAGVDGKAVSSPEEAKAAFDEAVHGPYRVLILSEDVEDMLGEAVVSWELGGKYPLLVTLPPLKGRRPGRASLVDMIREAIGVHV